MHLFRPDDRAMVEATERVEAALHPAAVLLFGSRAAGRDHPGSDYDLAVLLACRDGQALENFAVRTQTDYADLKISRAAIERRILEAKDR
jgi:predicted nucleotidyltransferase